VKAGTKVRVSHGDKSVTGVVKLCSANGKALAIKLNGLLDGHVGFMAVSRSDDGVYYAVVNGHVVLIETIPPAFPRSPEE
jgi:hypothetical protein